MSSPAELPARIGPYPVRALLGQGGQGRVYAVTDPMTGGTLALKQHLRTDRSTFRFRQEYLILSMLEHPNLPRAYRLGGSGDAIWLTMDRLEGVPAGVYVRLSGPADSASRQQRLLRLLCSVCEPLDTLHRRNIVHGDLKGSNLLAAPSGHTWLLDLGGAQLQRDGRTLSDRVLGTWSFAAPEVVALRSPDTRSDIYSLGLTAYRALTGANPQPGKTRAEVSASLSRPRPPIRTAHPDIAPALASLLEEMIAIDPADRPQDIPTLKARLADLGAQPPPTLSEPLPGEEAVYQALRSMLSVLTPGEMVMLSGPQSAVGRTLLARAAADAERLGWRALRAPRAAALQTLGGDRPTLAIFPDLRDRRQITALLAFQDAALEQGRPVCFVGVVPPGTDGIRLRTLTLSQTRRRLHQLTGEPVSAARAWQIHRACSGHATRIDDAVRAPLQPAPDADLDLSRVDAMLCSPHPEQAAPILTAALSAGPSGAGAARLWLALAGARKDEPAVRDDALDRALQVAPPQLLPELLARIATEPLGSRGRLYSLRADLHPHQSAPTARTWSALRLGRTAEAAQSLSQASPGVLSLLSQARLARAWGERVAVASLRRARPGIRWDRQRQTDLLIAESLQDEGRFTESIAALGPRPARLDLAAHWRIRQAESGLWLYRLGEVRQHLDALNLWPADHLPLTVRTSAACLRARLALLCGDPSAAAAAIRPVLKASVDAGRPQLAALLRAWLGRAAGVAGHTRQANTLTASAMRVEGNLRLLATIRCHRAIALAPAADPLPPLADLRPWLVAPQASLLWMEVLQASLDFALLHDQDERSARHFSTLQQLCASIADHLSEDDRLGWWLYLEVIGGRL